MATTLAQMTLAEENGIVIPARAARAAEDAGIPYAVACAFLEQESAGGQNIFGNDPGNYSGAGAVTEAKYADYKRRRQAGEGMQGVGPMQLTYWSLQDGADALGGCWRPRYNMLYAFRLLAQYHRTHGNWHAAAYQYNGSGDAAAVYADEVTAKITKWAGILHGA